LVGPLHHKLIAPFLYQFVHQFLLPRDSLLTFQNVAPLHGHCISRRKAAHFTPPWDEQTGAPR
jgi:hypothetical protein